MKYTVIFLYLSIFMMTGRLVGQNPGPPKILMMIGDGFNGNEFWEPYYAFSAAGYRVEVASYEIRPIICGNKSPDVNTDFVPHLLLEQVNPSDYVAFFLPGGKSPESLEKYPKSIALCREFNEQGILISSLCHGPRLLAQAGVMKERRVTYLHKVRDEIPEFYEAGELGYYQDLPLVKDGNLFTSRYPEDVYQLTRATLEELGESYPLMWPDREPSVLLVDGGANKLEFYAFLRAGLKSHATVKRIDINRMDTAHIPGMTELESYDLLVILDGKNMGNGNQKQLKMLAELWGNRPVMISKELQKQLERTFKHSAWLEGNVGDRLSMVVQTAYASTDRPRKAPGEEFSAYMAIEPDFDESAFLAMRTLLEVWGYKVGIVSAAHGHIKSMNGIVIASDRTYSELNELPRQTPIVDPGGIWPYEEPLEDYEQEHFEWILQQWKKGARVMSIGWGAYYLASMPEFRGMNAATSDQGEWSFGKRGGAKYAPEPALLTAPGLVTVKSTAHLKEGIEIFNCSNHQ